MLIKNATEEVHAARARHREQVVEKTRLRRLVERVDKVIESCEETHLQGVKEVPADLAVKADRVFTFARRAVRLTGDSAAVKAIDETMARRRIKVTEIMDMLWTIQEIVFDLMLPWRTQLPDDVDTEFESGAVWRDYATSAA